MSEPIVRPDVRAFLDQLKTQPRPPFNAEVLAMIRQLPPEMMTSMDVPVGELSVMRDFQCPGPAGIIPLRLFDVRVD